MGATGSGKTLLLRKLQKKCEIDETTSSVPTVGTSMFKMKMPNNKSIIIRELGGTVAPLWHHYYNFVEKIIFVVDTSNLCQISASGILLYSILTEPVLKNCKVLETINTLLLFVYDVTFSNDCRYCWYFLKWTCHIVKCETKYY